MKEEEGWGGEDKKKDEEDKKKKNLIKKKKETSKKITLVERQAGIYIPSYVAREKLTSHSKINKNNKL